MKKQAKKAPSQGQAKAKTGPVIDADVVETAETETKTSLFSALLGLLVNLCRRFKLDVLAQKIGLDRLIKRLELGTQWQRCLAFMAWLVKTLKLDLLVQKTGLDKLALRVWAKLDLGTRVAAIKQTLGLTPSQGFQISAFSMALPKYDPVDDEEETGFLKGQILFIMIFAFVAIALIWASTAELDKQVRADGAIIPTSEVQIVQARLPGLITDIRVDLGSVVKKGDVMFRMEDEDVIAEFEDNEIMLTSSRVAALRLQAESEGKQQLIFPPDLQEFAPHETAAESSLFSQRLKALQGEIDVLEQEVQSLERSIEEKTAAARIARNQASIHKQEYDLVKPLVDAGHEPKIKLIDAERRLQDSEGQAELALLSIKAMNSDLAARKKRIISVQENYRADASTRLIEVSTRLSQAEARKNALIGKVGYAEVKAPHSGIVSAIHLRTVGAVVQAGSLLAEIVPQEKTVKIRANLRPENVADVYVGQVARISLSAYDVSRYGSLEGRVEHIASNTTEREGQPPFYETIISIPNPKFSKATVEPDIVPGMTVVVDIIGGKRTVLDYILTPLDKATSVAFTEN